MSMRLLFSAFFIIFVGSAQAGTDELKPYLLKTNWESIPGDALLRMTELRTGKVRTGRANDPKDEQILQKHREIFKNVAEFLVYRVTQEKYYTLDTSPELKPRSLEDSLDSIFEDLNKHLLISDGTVLLTPDQGDYINEFGEALDRAIVDVFTKKNDVPPLPIRVNTARILAVVSRSGAKAHTQTILALLDNRLFKTGDKHLETPPDVLLYAMKAAEGLVAAYEPAATEVDKTNHAIPDVDIIALVKHAERWIDRGLPESVMKSVAFTKLPKPEEGDEEKGEKDKEGKAQLDNNELSREHKAVLLYYRKHAVRVVARVRFDVVGDVSKQSEIRPAWTLTRVVLSDKTITPAPTRTEVCDAIIGLCGIEPSRKHGKEFLNTHEHLLVIASGLDRFFNKKIVASADRSIHWRVATARISAALVRMENGAKFRDADEAYRKKLGELVSLSKSTLLDPMLRSLDPQARAGNNTPSLEKLKDWINANPSGDRSTLYKDRADLRPTPRPLSED